MPKKFSALQDLNIGLRDFQIIFENTDRIKSVNIRYIAFKVL